jgi:hypothetical protein
MARIDSGNCRSKVLNVFVTKSDYDLDETFKGAVWSVEQSSDTDGTEFAVINRDSDWFTWCTANGIQNDDLEVGDLIRIGATGAGGFTDVLTVMEKVEVSKLRNGCYVEGNLSAEHVGQQSTRVAGDWWTAQKLWDNRYLPGTLSRPSAGTWAYQWGLSLPHCVFDSIYTLGYLYVGGTTLAVNDRVRIFNPQATTSTRIMKQESGPLPHETDLIITEVINVQSYQLFSWRHWRDVKRLKFKDVDGNAVVLYYPIRAVKYRSPDSHSHHGAAPVSRFTTMKITGYQKFIDVHAGRLDLNNMLHNSTGHREATAEHLIPSHRSSAVVLTLRFDEADSGETLSVGDLLHFNANPYNVISLNHRNSAQGIPGLTFPMGEYDEEHDLAPSRKAWQSNGSYPLFFMRVVAGYAVQVRDAVTAFTEYRAIVQLVRAPIIDFYKGHPILSPPTNTLAHGGTDEGLDADLRDADENLVLLQDHMVSTPASPPPTADGVYDTVCVFRMDTAYPELDYGQMTSGEGPSQIWGDDPTQWQAIGQIGYPTLPKLIGLTQQYHHHSGEDDYRQTGTTSADALHVDLHLPDLHFHDNTTLRVRPASQRTKAEYASLPAGQKLIGQIPAYKSVNDGTFGENPKMMPVIEKDCDDIRHGTTVDGEGAYRYMHIPGYDMPIDGMTGAICLFGGTIPEHTGLAENRPRATAAGAAADTENAAQDNEANDSTTLFHLHSNSPSIYYGQTVDINSASLTAYDRTLRSEVPLTKPMYAYRLNTAVNCTHVHIPYKYKLHSSTDLEAALSLRLRHTQRMFYKKPGSFDGLSDAEIGARFEECMPMPLYKVNKWLTNTGAISMKLDHGVKALNWIKLCGYSVFNKRQVGFAHAHEQISDDWVTLRIDGVDGDVVSNNTQANGAFAVLHVGSHGDNSVGAIEYHAHDPDGLHSHVFECPQSNPSGELRLRFTDRQGGAAHFGRIHLWFKICVAHG